MSTVSNDVFLGKVRELTLARLRALVRLYPTPPHTNKDAYYSPARWWYDVQGGERHSLSTSASMSMSGTVISIRLDYTIEIAS